MSCGILVISVQKYVIYPVMWTGGLRNRLGPARAFGQGRSGRGLSPSDPLGGAHVDRDDTALAGSPPLILQWLMQ